MVYKGKKVTHKNKFYENGAKFHISLEGIIYYFSDTYNKWMISNFTSVNNLVKI